MPATAWTLYGSRARPAGCDLGRFGRSSEAFSGEFSGEFCGEIAGEIGGDFFGEFEYGFQYEPAVVSDPGVEPAAESLDPGGEVADAAAVVAASGSGCFQPGFAVADAVIGEGETYRPLLPYRCDRTAVGLAVPQHVRKPLAQDGGQYGVDVPGERAAFDPRDGVDVERGQHGHGVGDLSGQAHVAVSGGYRPYVGQRLARGLQNLCELLLGAVRLAGQQPVGQLAFEGDGGQAVAQQVVEVAREAQPFLVDGEPGQVGAGLVNLRHQVRQPGETEDHQAGQDGGDGGVRDVAPAQAHVELQDVHAEGQQAEGCPGQRVRQDQQGRAAQQPRQWHPCLLEGGEREEGEQRLKEKDQQPVPAQPRDQPGERDHQLDAEYHQQ
nr:two-component system sensor kinase [uncultured bacterium]